MGRTLKHYRHIMVKNRTKHYCYPYYTLLLSLSDAGTYSGGKEIYTIRNIKIHHNFTEWNYI